MQFKILIHNTFCTVQFSYIRALCIFMLNFQATQENRIACAYSLLPPPPTFTLNWAQFHKKLWLLRHAELQQNELDFLALLWNMKAPEFSPGFSFHGDSSMQLESFEKCQAPNEKEVELLVEVSWEGGRERRSEILHYPELVLTDELKCKSRLRFPTPGHKVKLLGFSSVF